MAPAAWTPSASGGSDKLGHALLYLGFGLLLWWMLPGPPRSRAALVIAIGLPIGVALEWLQGFVPGRHSDPADALADLGGLVAATALGLASANAKR